MTQAAGELSTLQQIYLALGALFILGILSGICVLPSYFEERERMKLLVKDDNERNLREYRDQDDGADGVYKEDDPQR